MAARHFGIPGQSTRAWRDTKRDWKNWSRGERIAAPLIFAGLVAATVPVLWLIAQ